MVEGSEVALGVGADAQRLPRRPAVAERTEHLVAPHDELDRATDHLRCENAERDRPRQQAF
jgi:hypothetical protein